MSWIYHTEIKQGLEPGRLIAFLRQSQGNKFADTLDQLFRPELLRITEIGIERRDG